MSYLLDTSVVSESVKSRPDINVIDWLNKVPDEAMHISVLTLGEIRKGVELLADSKRKEQIRLWMEQDLMRWFGQRLLPVDQAVAEQWGMLISQSVRTMPAIDSLIAATAIHHGLRLVTRNVKDFDFTGMTVINPWND